MKITFNSVNKLLVFLKITLKCDYGKSNRNINIKCTNKSNIDQLDMLKNL